MRVVRASPPVPGGWAESTLGEICDPAQYGWTTSADSHGTGLRFLRTTDLSSGWIDWSAVPFCLEAPKDVDKYRLRPGDIVISRAGSVGLSALIGDCPDAVFASYLIRFRPNVEMDAKFVAYFLQSPRYWSVIASSAAGIALQNVNATKLSAIAIPIPPLLEQCRIVAQIDTHLTRLDAAVAALERARFNLKRYRAAILKAACEGRLVPTEAEIAHAQSREYEPAEVFLASVQSERRANWEADQLVKKQAAGKSPKDDKWRAKYVDPELPKTDEMPTLPEGWSWASLESITNRIGDVDHKMPEAVDAGIPYVSTRDFCGDDGMDFAGAKKISKESYEALARKIAPKKGDLLLSRYGTVGVVRRVDTGIEFQASYSVAILKTVSNEVLTKYLAIALQSDQLQAQMLQSIRASSQPDLGLEYIRRLLVPLPPATEQFRIVGEIERRWSILVGVERVLDRGLRRAHMMRLAVLNSAFEGGLAPQDQNDEAASSLLARIKAARLTNGASSVRRRVNRSLVDAASQATSDKALP